MHMHQPPVHSRTAGKATVAALFAFVAVFILSILIDTEYASHTNSVQATSTATTTVRVLNIPPVWTVTAYELYPSSTSTPTNSGTSTVWAAVGSDNNSEDYYLLICKASSTPTTSTTSPPVCGGGLSNQWGRSALASSGAMAIVSTTTTEAMNEKNDWYGYICDTNSGSPRCNATMYNGLHEPGPASATSSPFVVNHRPTFTLAADDSPKYPGELVTWTTTATDTIDVIRGGDQLRLYVCKQNIFDATIPACGGTGGWATSSFTVLGGPSATTTLAIPLQDGNHDAYVYIIDQFNHTASGGWQASSTVLSVRNAAPYVSSSTIELYDRYGSTTNDFTMELTAQEGQTQGYVLQMDVSDDNSCRTLANGFEVSDVDVNVFRTTAGDPYGYLCDSTLEYNANRCYTDRSANFVPTCYQVPGATCTATTTTMTWECVFPLWYIADPTDPTSAQAAEDWRASARASDEALTGVYSTSDAPADTTELLQFLSFRATGSPIAYGAWEPGQNTGTHIATTTLYATGNTGLNQYLSGDAMCVGYPAVCSGLNTNTIYVPFQHFSLTNSTLYAAGTELSTTTSPTFVDVIITKPTATSSPTNDDTFWAIGIPGSITFAGDYTGRNYIDALVAPSGEW